MAAEKEQPKSPAGEQNVQPESAGRLTAENVAEAVKAAKNSADEKEAEKREQEELDKQADMESSSSYELQENLSIATQLAGMKDLIPTVEAIISETTRDLASYEHEAQAIQSAFQAEVATLKQKYEPRFQKVQGQLKPMRDQAKERADEFAPLIGFSPKIAEFVKKYGGDIAKATVKSSLSPVTNNNTADSGSSKISGTMQERIDKAISAAVNGKLTKKQITDAIGDTTPNQRYAHALIEKMMSSGVLERLDRGEYRVIA